ncbi:hypothetical protein BMF94_5558 [Rhodotorula taiwanensis]|uniref:Condensation domain-containing protein n=1 Tax=Rhodotorula taiwanensis TaxID=741276 RepID=A0A2S5B3A9_9BASI|nr:hypothetical protein BMF94_5558 [Rhodotorula taiwanensis]
MTGASNAARQLGPTEKSFYLGSRGDGPESGVNDMYLHIGVRARPSLLTRDRILKTWSAVLDAHPLLSAGVEFVDYEDISFRSCSSAAGTEALHPRTEELVAFESGRSASEIISSYLNGPRTLSDEKLSYLVISRPGSAADVAFGSAADHVDDEMRDFDFFLFSTHFLGDGMALHSTAGEFFRLLTAEQNDEISPSKRTVSLPVAAEDRLPIGLTNTRFGAGIARADYEKEQARQIGAHTFPRERLGPRQTLVPTVSYPAEKSKRILAACKSHGVTLAHSIFALAAVAYTKTAAPERRRPEMPLMLYSAVNIRPYLKPVKGSSDWYHLAIGFYNIILPSFFVKDASVARALFWHRAQSVKCQTTRIVKSPFLPTRTLLMAKQRETSSIRWEREADEQRARSIKSVENGLKELNVKQESDAAIAADHETEDGAPVTVESVAKVTSTSTFVPQTALMGLSMLGNLDGMYKHAEYSGVELHSLTTGSRQRAGALLLFAYTFAGKLWLSLGYDVNGFERGVIEKWWDALQCGIDGLLLDENAIDDVGSSRGRQ